MRRLPPPRRQPHARGGRKPRAALHGWPLPGPRAPLAYVQDAVFQVDVATLEMACFDCADAARVEQAEEGRALDLADFPALVAGDVRVARREEPSELLLGERVGDVRLGRAPRHVRQDGVGEPAPEGPCREPPRYPAAAAARRRALGLPARAPRVDHLLGQLVRVGIGGGAVPVERAQVLCATCAPSAGCDSVGDEVVEVPGEPAREVAHTANTPSAAGNLDTSMAHVLRCSMSACR